MIGTKVWGSSGSVPTSRNLNAKAAVSYDVINHINVDIPNLSL